MPLAVFNLKSCIVIWMSSRNGDQVGQTDILNSKTAGQTKFGTARLLLHIQLHSTIESETILSNLIANNDFDFAIDHIVVFSQEWYGNIRFLC